MKSGLAAMAYALCHLDGEPACSIQFLGTCDEEKGGLGAEMALKEKAMADGRWILVGEPTGMKLGIAQKGCLWLEISARGVTSHGAYPQEGANAVYGASEIGAQIKAYVEQSAHPLLGSSTAQITMIEGGVANNMTPDRCRAVMDIRMVPGMTREMVLGKAREALEKLKEKDSRFEADFTVLNDRRAIEISSSHPMVKLLGKELREAGYEEADLGINFFDTANGYSAGTSEEYLGRAIRDFARREDVVVATKFLPRTQEEIAAGISGQQHIEQMVNTSLKNLGMDYIDLYIYHMWDYETPLYDIMDGLNRVVEAGKVRYIGISNCFAYQLAKANALAEKEAGPKYASVTLDPVGLLRQLCV